MGARERLKSVLTSLAGRRPPEGMTLLTYHRVGGGTSDELDLPTQALEQQLDRLLDSGVEVLALDAALDRLAAGDATPSVVLTFDDAFDDVHRHAWPLLRERSLPFTVYVPAGLIGRPLRWEGSSASSQGAAAMTWEQLAEMYASGLGTIGNHTFDHAEPSGLDAAQLDDCSDLVEERLGVRPRHFAFTWGVEVPAVRELLKDRFRSAATGAIGRNRVGCDPWRLHRVPVRRTDPPSFFEAKLHDPLRAELGYERIVRAAKLARPRT